jgi:hypothetical protein
LWETDYEKDKVLSPVADFFTVIDPDTYIDVLLLTYIYKSELNNSYTFYVILLYYDYEAEIDPEYEIIVSELKYLIISFNY